MMEKSENQAGSNGEGHKAKSNMTVAEVDRNHFPSRLHTMLSSLENSPDGLGGVCSWQPHGRVFMIRDTERFIQQVLPKWFCRLKYTSFQRQLCLFGFRKLSKKGPDQGGYYHLNFIRERLDLAMTIQPGKIKGKRGRRPKSDENEPDFYRNPSSESLGPTKAQEVAPSPRPATGQDATPKAPKPEAEKGVQDLFSLSKDDSPDQLSLEAIMHQPNYREDILDNRQSGLLSRLGASQLSGIPMQQSLAAESRPIAMAPSGLLEDQGTLQLEDLMFPQFAATAAESAATPTIALPAAAVAGVTAGRMNESSMADSTPTWGWDSFSALEEIPPASAPLDQAPAPSLTTGGSVSYSYSQLQTQQLLPDEEQLQLQQILERQRLRDLMDLNQAQQKNLKIQQEQLEQQRLELQMRDQEQLYQLRMELQNREDEQRRQSAGRMVEPLPRPPRLFDPQRTGRLSFESQRQQQQQRQSSGQERLFPGLFQQSFRDDRDHSQGR